MHAVFWLITSLVVIVLSGDRLILNNKSCTEIVIRTQHHQWLLKSSKNCKTFPKCSKMQCDLFSYPLSAWKQLISKCCSVCTNFNDTVSLACVNQTGFSWFLTLLTSLAFLMSPISFTYYRSHLNFSWYAYCTFFR